MSKKYLRREVPALGGTNKAVFTALYDGIRALPCRKMAGFFRKAGYDAPDPACDLQCTTLLAAAATAAAAAAVLLLRR